MTFHGSSPAIGILEGILPVPQDIFSDVHNELVESGLIRYQLMERVMEPGVPLENLLDPVSSQCLLGLLNGFLELTKDVFRDDLGDDSQRVSLQDRTKLEEFFHFLFCIPGDDEPPFLARFDEAL